MIVLDCNAAIAMVMGTDEGEAMRNLVMVGERMIAPAFFRIETAHALGKYVHGAVLGESDALGKLEQAVALVDEFADDATLYVEAFNESLRLGHSSYDMLYFVLARRTGATLFTLDKRLSDVCLGNGVNCLYQTKL